MLYQSTRDKNERVTASKAILNGLASEGGLYIPEEFPTIPITGTNFLQQTYQELAYEIMQPLLADFSEEELKKCISKAYNDKFTDKKIAPLNKQGADYYLELFHGPTLAFKDMALSILPYLMTTALKKQEVDQEIVILTATSGDTGKAAMEGFADVEGTKIIVFYPKDGVSDIQKKQMLTQKGENTFVVGIDGNFDDAQTSVKQMFEDQELKQMLNQHNMQFSSANSINIGRLIPQIVYYFYGYQQLVKKGEIELGEKINVSVPTGNFGNILAGHYAKKMGLPISQLICASNRNKVLTDFFDTGSYLKNRDFFVTNSPSMDILVSSNLERLLFELVNKDNSRLISLMHDLNRQGNYHLLEIEKNKMGEFYAGFAEEREIEEVIQQVYEKSGYVIDPHTAVAKKVADDYRKTEKEPLKLMIVSTASPYKFPVCFIGKNHKGKEVETLHEKTQLPIPKVIEELNSLPILYKTNIKTSGMKQTVLSLLNL